MKVVVDRLAWFSKEDLTVTQLQAIRHALTIVPRKVGDHPGDPPKPLKLWLEDDHQIGVAREYFLQNRKSTHDVEFALSEGDVGLWGGPVEFVGTLRPNQQEAVDCVVGAFRSGKLGGILRAAPGWGKTVVSLAIIAEMKVPALIVVHKEFLVNQWLERINQFLPEALVGKVQQDVCDIAGRHVVIAMVQSLAARQYPPTLYSWPGIVLTDEVHRIGAETWSPTPVKFRARWRLGVSATPRRKDGADKVFLHHIGPVLYASQEARLRPQVKRVWTKFRLVKTPRFNPNLAHKSLILKFLIASDLRNALITEKLVQAVEAGRKVLVLSERLKHLDTLAARFRETWAGPPDWKGPTGERKPSIGFYVGGKTEEERRKASTATIIFATTQFASEGLDIPAMDTLFLTTPIGDVEQAVGRILRPSKGKKEPIVVDFRDDGVPMFRKMGELRDRHYAKVT